MVEAEARDADIVSGDSLLNSYAVILNSCVETLQLETRRCNEAEWLAWREVGWTGRVGAGRIKARDTNGKCRHSEQLVVQGCSLRATLLRLSDAVAFTWSRRDVAANGGDV